MSNPNSYEGADPPALDALQRGVLAKVVMKLLDLWMLGCEDQAALLGIAPGNRDVLDRHRQGEPIGASSEQFERALLLLEIHDRLQILLASNGKLAGRGMTSGNRAFDNRTPLEVIKAQGTEGLSMVRSYLERARGAS